MDLLDPNILQRRAANPRASVWVGASAGSGKTKVLTDRVLSILLDGVAPEKILCITFTKAAAAEMSDRLGKRLGTWATMEEGALRQDLRDLIGQVADDERVQFARQLFARVLDTAGGLKIQTIHSFCQSLLGRFPLEAGVPPHFEVLDERQAQDLMRQARDRVLNDARNDGEMDKALSRVTRRVQEDQFAQLFQILSSERNRLDQFIYNHDGIEGAITALYEKLGVEKAQTEEALSLKFCEEGQFDRTALKEACLLQLASSKSFKAIGEKIEAWLSVSSTEERAKKLDLYISAFLTTALESRKNLLSKGDATAHEYLAVALEKEQDRILRFFECKKALQVAIANDGLLRLGHAMVTVYRDLKRMMGRLDYDDLILKAGDLLTSAHHIAAWVLYKLDGGLDHILIDEAQDTNKEQWTVVGALAEEFFVGAGTNEEVQDKPRTIFAVGDVKQSIYSFQRADPSSFHHFKRYFHERVAQAQLPWDDVPMDVSFRSTTAVLGLVDSVFDQDGTRLGPDMGRIQHHAFREGQAGSVELWPLLGPESGDAAGNWTMPVTQGLGASHHMRMAQVLASQIEEWLRGDKRRFLPAKGRNVEPGDILILVRRRSELVDHLVRELKNRHIPVAGVDRMVLSKQMAVMDLMALARFLLLQEDDLSLAEVLKSPLVGLDEDGLMDLAMDRRGKSLWQSLCDWAADDPKYARIHLWLSQLLNKTDFIRPFELFSHILSAHCPAVMPGAELVEHSGAQAFVARLGVEAEDPLEEFLTLTLNYEQGRTPSLQGFIHWFDSGETQIKRDLESGERGEIRIMTVHGAKGLQAPLVIMPDTVRDKGVSKSPLIYWVPGEESIMPIWLPSSAMAEIVMSKAKEGWISDQDEEYRRLLYVALTRAEDQLVVCGYRTKRAPSDDCWYYLVERGLRAISETRKDEAHFSFASGKVWEGEGLIWETDQKKEISHKQTSIGQSETVAALPAWATQGPGQEPARPTPLMPSQSALEAPAMRSPLSPDGSFGLKRGLIIHRLLQSLPDIAVADRVRAMDRYLAQSNHDITDTQGAEIRKEVLTLLDLPDMQALMGEGSRAEVPVSGEVGSDKQGKSIIVSGQIDRLVVGRDRIIIADYKTLRPVPKSPGEVPESYLNQMAAYRAIMEKIYPEREVSCVIVWTDIPKVMEIPNALLDPWAPAT